MLHLFYPVDGRKNNLDCCKYILELPDDRYPYLVYCARDNLYRKTDCNYLVLYDTQNTDSIYHYGCQSKSGNTDYRDQKLQAAMLKLNDNQHMLLENLLSYDLD